MSAVPKTKSFTELLEEQIVRAPGMVKFDRDRALRTMVNIAQDGYFDESAIQRNTLAALQLAVRNKDVWNALVAAKAKLERA